MRDSLAIPRQTPVVSHALAVPCVAAALGVSLLLRGMIDPGTVLLAGVMSAAWFGGTGAGLLAALLATLAFELPFLPPPGAPPAAGGSVVRFAAFALSALLVGASSATRQRTERALRAMRDEMETRVRERAESLARTRERAVAALRESEELWRAAFENNPTMYFLVEEQGTILSVNPFGAAQLGYTVEELVGRPVLDVFHPADRDAVREHTAECVRQLGRTLRWEARKVRRDGTVLSVRESARAILMKDGPLVLVVCEDVTEQKRAEYLTSQVFESTPDGVSVVGRDYRYQRVNPVYEEIWGIPAGRIVGREVADLLGADVFEQKVRPNLDRCFAGEDVSYGGWFANPRGLRYLAVTFSPLRPDSETVEAALMISRDLTEHMQASEALRAAQAELAHVTRVTMLGEITASIAHEVNQPLAAVVMSGNACRRWLDADPPDLDEARSAAQRVIDDGNRASEVIRRVRSLLERQEPERTRLEINEVIRETLALTRSELADHHVVVRAELGEGLPPVVGDRVGLQQVLVNLILNGADAMSGLDGSRRVLTVRSRAGEGGGVVVEVQDRGRGIGAGEADRIFEPFFSTKPGGLGMGLSISRSIVEAHQGRLWATPNEGAGATLHFSLPACTGGAS